MAGRKIGKTDWGMLLCMACLVIFLSSCSDQPDSVGTLEILFPSSRTIEPSGDAISVTHLKIWGKQTDGAAVLGNQIRAKDSSITIKGLKAGTWTISICGLSADDASSVVTKSAQQSVTIHSGKTSTATFDLSYLSDGVGTCSITLQWPEKAVNITNATCSLKQNGTEKYSFLSGDTSGTNTVAVDSNDAVDTGTYDLDVTLTNRSGSTISLPTLDTVKIYSQKHSTGTETLDFDCARITSMIASGSFSAGTTANIEIGSFPSGVNVYYTTDGSEPTVNSNLYAGPIALTDTTTVKAVAAADGYGDSDISSGEYTASNFAITTPPTIDSIDIVTDDYATYAAVITGETGMEAKTYSWYLNGTEQSDDNHDHITLSGLVSGRRYRIMVKIKKGDEDLNTFSTTKYFTIP